MRALSRTSVKFVIKSDLRVLQGTLGLHPTISKSMKLFFFTFAMDCCLRLLRLSKKNSWVIGFN